MEDNKVPYIVFEESQVRHERTVRRMIVALIICISLLFASNVAWLWFFNQFDITSEDIIVDGGMSGRYSRDGYYYDGGGMSHRRGRAKNGRFVSRDGSEMARKLRNMMEEAPDDNIRSEIRRLADKMENM